MAKLKTEAKPRLEHPPAVERNCAVCVRNAATGRQHRATLHPMSYTLSSDVRWASEVAGYTLDCKGLRYFWRMHADTPSQRRGGSRVPPILEDGDALKTAYFAVPMRNKKASSVLPALQRIYVDIKALGFHYITSSAWRQGWGTEK